MASRWTALRAKECQVSFILALFSTVVGCGSGAEAEVPPNAQDSTVLPSTVETTAPNPSSSVDDASETDAGNELAEIPQGCEVVEFGSLVVEMEVRRQTGIESGSIPGTAVLGVVELTDLLGVDSLDGVECLTSLQHIRVTEGQLVDLEPLRPLQQIETVSVSENAIADISALSGKEHLSRISALSNQIADLEDLTLLSPPPAGLCDWYNIDLRGNSLDALDVAQICERGWSVVWGYEATEACNAPRCVDAR